MSQKVRPATYVVTGKVRFSYAHVHKPQASEEGKDPKYSVSVIIPKSDTKTIEKIEAAVKAAMEQGKSSKFEGKIPKNIKLPLRDGDEEREDDPAYAGCYFLNASSSQKPEIVDEDRQSIMEEKEFYSGCYGRISINFFPYNTSGNKGVAAGMNSIQKLEDGERLGGAQFSADDDFGDDDDDIL